MNSTAGSIDSQVPSTSGNRPAWKPGHVRQEKERRGIALCLSGGGYRAALFHLGALRRLHELGVLAQVDRISSVSGGSIFAAFFADRLVRAGKAVVSLDWEKDVAAPFRAYVHRDLRTLPIVVHVLWNWALPGFRARHLERRYRERLTSLTLRELPERPSFTFCASDITFGVNWEFTREYAGDYQAGYLTEAASWPVARAVAASSCFPPVFGPFPIGVPAENFKEGKCESPDRSKLLARIELSDGGVYDNMGLEPAWKAFAYVLISDCGAPFTFTAGTNLIRRLMRYTSVVMNQAQSVRKRFFFSDINDRKLKGTYWPMQRVVEHPAPNSTFAGYSNSLVEMVICKIRTDLDSFSQAECLVLENHGYTLADESVRRRVPELIGPSPAPFAVPGPEWTDEAKVRHALRDSHKRFSPRRILGWD
jgi:NTE family protein